MSAYRRSLIRLSLLVSVLAAVLAVLAAPTPAQAARSYEISRVDIDATVTEDGQLRVTETRTFDFDGSFNGVYWIIPTGYNSANGKNVDVEVTSAGEGTAGSLTPFERSDTGLDGTYELSSQGADATMLKLYSAHTDEEVSFTISYVASGIVTRWEDTGELYWKFVSDGWDVPSDNVTCTLHLPVPAGESVVPGDTVRAWGHGPLDASVAFDGNDVVYSVPGVGTDEFAEMRVAFPAAWVSALEQTPGAELPTILSEEQAWADEANAQRRTAQIVHYGTISVGVAMAMATAAFAIQSRLRYKRDFTPRFQDPYFRDVPTADHPAVLGALMNGGKAEGKELTATLMRLTDAGVVRLDKVTVTKQGLLGAKTSEDYRLAWERALAPSAGEKGSQAYQTHRIDRQALDFLFKSVGGFPDGTAAGAQAPAGEKDAEAEKAPTLLFSRVESFAKSHPEKYSSAYEAWTGCIEGAYLARFTGDGLKGYHKVACIVLGSLCLALAFVELVMLLFQGSSVGVIFAMTGLLLAAGATGLVCGLTMRDINHEAIEVRAQLEALRRWLTEFTRLGEAVPSDVVLWNRLLVMAVVLGVADQVIEQLKVALPELLEDPYFMPTYGWWYWGGHGMRPPAAAFSDRLSSAHNVSTAALAETRGSSGAGFGGGFSGGGGGGFGGGGGGGAF